MNFTQVVQEVMNIIKRPDKILDARREVNSAVNQFCADVSPGFNFDIVEASPVISNTALTQSILLNTMPRFRKFHYIKQGGTSVFLDVLPRKELLKGSCCDMRNKYYIAGDRVNISLSKNCNTVDLAYFAAPPLLTDAAPDFWMLNLSPYMVIDRAAAKLFTNIGDDTSAGRHEGYARAAFLIAQKDYGVATQ